MHYCGECPEVAEVESLRAKNERLKKTIHTLTDVIYKQGQECEQFRSLLKEARFWVSLFDGTVDKEMLARIDEALK